jgi:hypothetical protein
MMHFVVLVEARAPKNWEGVITHDLVTTYVVKERICQAIAFVMISFLLLLLENYEQKWREIRLLKTH